MLAVEYSKFASHRGANVTAMRCVTRIAESTHEFSERAGYTRVVPAGISRRAGEAKTRQRRDNDVEVLTKAIRKPDVLHN